jgi:hypothetical protein
MRRDYLIAILLAVAAFPAGATLMVAPEYLHLTGAAVPLTFWGGIGLTAILILIAAAIAWRAKPQEAPKGKDRPAVSPYCNTPHDISLLDALWRVYMRIWGERKKVEMGDDPNANPETFKFAKVCDDIRQKAFEGALPAWATRRDSQLYEPLPLEFWLNRQLLPNIMMDPTWPDLWVEYTHALLPGESKFARSMEWRNFLTNKERVDRLWPPKKEDDV